MKNKNSRRTLIVGYGQDAKVLKDQISKYNKKIYIITNKKIKNSQKNILFKILNIGDRNAVFSFLKKFKNLDIYFFATHNISSTQQENSKLFVKNLETNVTGLTNFLEFMSNNKRNNFKLFYSCSSHIFENTKTKKQNEMTTPSFSSHYAFVKYLGLEICHYYRNVKKVFCSAGILYTHVSKYVNNSFLIKELSLKIKKTKNQTIYVNDPNSKIDLMLADDAVKAIRKIMQLNKPDTFIISSGKTFYIKKIFKEIVNYNNIKKKFILRSKKKLKYKKKFLFGNNTKLRNSTSWSVKNNLKDIIKEVLN